MENIFTPNQRILILQGLKNDPAGSLSNEMIQRLLKEYGHTLGITEVNEQINWLELRGYVKTKRLMQHPLVIVTILKPGREVADGFIRVEGIDSPVEE